MKDKYALKEALFLNTSESVTKKKKKFCLDLREAVLTCLEALNILFHPYSFVGCQCSV